MFFKKFKIIFSLLEKSQRTSFFYLMLMTFFAFCLEVIGIGTIIPILNLIARDDFLENYSWFIEKWFLDEIPSKERLLLYLIILFLCLSFVKSLYLAFLARKQSNFGYSVIGVISAKLYKIYLNRPYAFFLSSNSSTLIRNTIIEVNQLGAGLMNPLLSLITEVFIILAVSFVLIMVEPIGYLVTVVLLGSSTLFFVLTTKRLIGKWGIKRQHLDASRLRAISESFQTVKEIKLLRKENNFLSNYKKIITENIYVMSMNNWFQNLPRIFLEFVSMLGLCTLIVMLIFLGNDLDSILATMGLFTLAIFRVLPSLNRIATSIQSIRFSMASIDVIAEEFKDNSSTNFQSPNHQSTDQLIFDHNIEISNLSFAFQPMQKNVLENINLIIKKNSSIGIIGETGSGKSTLINLILGLLETNNGEILVDNVSIQSNLVAWQRKIGYVAQDIILIDATIKNNVAFGVNDADINENRISEVIKLSKLDKFIDSQENGLDTIIGENGARLSGGQRQRLGIARALYRESEIIILDEATSALDHETELEFMNAINSLANQKTLIIIAHRLSTLKSCDIIYKLEGGKIVGHGPSEIMLK